MARTGKKGDFDVTKSSKLLKALADTDRLRLVLQLKEGEKNVGTLAHAIKTEIVNVSHHLGVLRGSGLVKDRKVGRFVYYTLNSDVIEKHGSTLHFRLAGATLIIS
jgi:DNA-binding transcriptional ArsR family regulator